MTVSEASEEYHGTSPHHGRLLGVALRLGRMPERPCFFTAASLSLGRGFGILPLLYYTLLLNFCFGLFQSGYAESSWHVVSKSNIVFDSRQVITLISAVALLRGVSLLQGSVDDEADSKTDAAAA